MATAIAEAPKKKHLIFGMLVGTEECEFHRKDGMILAVRRGGEPTSDVALVMDRDGNVKGGAARLQSAGDLCDALAKFLESAE